MNNTEKISAEIYNIIGDYFFVMKLDKKERQELKEKLSTAINQTIAEEKERVENILDKYYAYQQEDGSYTHDPQGNQLIDIIRADILSSLDKLKEI